MDMVDALAAIGLWMTPSWPAPGARMRAQAMAELAPLPPVRTKQEVVRVLWERMKAASPSPFAQRATAHDERLVGLLRDDTAHGLQRVADAGDTHAEILEVELPFPAGSRPAKEFAAGFHMANQTVAEAYAAGGGRPPR